MGGLRLSATATGPVNGAGGQNFLTSTFKAIPDNYFLQENTVYDFRVSGFFVTADPTTGQVSPLNDPSLTVAYANVSLVQFDPATGRRLAASREAEFSAGISGINLSITRIGNHSVITKEGLFNTDAVYEQYEFGFSVQTRNRIDFQSLAFNLSVSRDGHSVRTYGANFEGAESVFGQRISAGVTPLIETYTPNGVGLGGTFTPRDGFAVPEPGTMAYVLCGGGVFLFFTLKDGRKFFSQRRLATPLLRNFTATHADPAGGA